jgi:hypothetical protein
MLDTVRPVRTLPLQPSSDVFDLLTIGEPFNLTLASGEPLTIWCARTPYGRYVLEIKYKGRILVRTEADAPISSYVFLPDGKLYEFSIRVEA